MKLWGYFYVFNISKLVETEEFINAKKYKKYITKNNCMSKPGQFVLWN